MNNSTSSINKVIFVTLDSALNSVGSKWPQEIVFLCVIPMGAIGTLLNIFGLIILNGEDFQLPIYDYMRIYTLNSTCISFATIFRFINNSRRFFAFSNTNTAQFFTGNIFIPIINILFCYGGYLDSLLTFDRVVLLSGTMKWFHKLNPKIVCFTIFVASNIAMMPYWFFYKTAMRVVKLSPNETFSLYTYTTTPFAKGDTGVLLRSIGFAIADITPLVLLISFSISTVILLKRYTVKKMRLMQSGTNNGTNENTANLSTTKNSDLNSIKPKGGVKAKKDKKLLKMEIKVTTVVIVLSILSFL
jgi:hypothetical protein